MIKGKIVSLLSIFAVIGTTPSVVLAGTNSRTLEGGTATIACYYVPREEKVHVLWRVSVADQSKPIYFVRWKIKLSNGQSRTVAQPRPGQPNPSGGVNFEALLVTPGLTATIEGFAFGVNPDVTYIYRIDPPLPASCF